MDVYSAVGELVGKSLRTISEGARCAETFDQSVRDTYNVLPFSHFTFAASHPGQEERILSLALRQCDNNGGRPPSCEWLEVNFGGVSRDNAMPVERMQKYAEVVPQMAQNLYESSVSLQDDCNSGPQPADERLLVAQLQRVFAALKMVVGLLPESQMKVRLVEAIKQIDLAVAVQV
jgi:hypothetical protein